MTTITSSSPARAETPFQQEQRIFGENFSRLIDALLNRIFDLRPAAANSRFYYLLFLFLLSGFVICLFYNPPYMWAPYFQDIFNFLFASSYVPIFPGNPFYNLVNFGIQAITDPHVLQYLPIFLAPFFIALQTAASYLADVFELEDPGVARHFIYAVALRGSNQTIRITHGEIYEEHSTSPTYLIGGPGKVIVDIDSVALFEKPDGTPSVIGPTGKKPGGKVQLDGFERLRQAFDLRDHFIDLRKEEGISVVVKSRSQDGIPITATDVRFMFSVHRDHQPSTKDNPYPFSESAIEQLVYKATSRVTPGQVNPSAFNADWYNNMVSLIRSRLGGFMNEHKLAEYLASIGPPEVERISHYEAEIEAELKTLAPSAIEELPKAREVKPAPEFTSRYKIKNLFSQFAEEFTKSQYDRGVELHWIGVGTWRTPIESISKKHMDAWTISRENLGKSSDFVMEQWKSEATLQEMINLIQDVPVAAYRTSIEKNPNHENALKALLVSYQQQLITARNFISAKGEPVPEEIQRAIETIKRSFPAHFL